MKITLTPQQKRQLEQMHDIERDSRVCDRIKAVLLAYAGVVVSDQCPSYNWIVAKRHQLCWAHVKRNLQQMADYSGGGHNAYIGKHLCLLSNAIFRTRHRYEQDEIDYALYLRRMRRLQKSFDCWLSKGTDVMVKRYRGRCKLLIKHRESLWVFLKKTSIPLT